MKRSKDYHDYVFKDGKVMAAHHVDNTIDVKDVPEEKPEERSDGEQDG